MNIRNKSVALATAAMLAIAQSASASPIGSEAVSANESPDSYVFSGTETFGVSQPSDDFVRFDIPSDRYFVSSVFTRGWIDVVFSFDGPDSGEMVPAAGALVSPVPEPGTLALFAIAGAGLLARRKHKR